MLPITNQFMNADGLSVDAHGEHREVALVREARQNVALEPLTAGRAERRAVGPALPAQAVQLERVREIPQHALAVGGERVLEFPSSLSWRSRRRSVLRRFELAWRV